MASQTIDILGTIIGNQAKSIAILQSQLEVEQERNAMLIKQIEELTSAKVK